MAQHHRPRQTRSRVVPIAIEIDAGIKTDTSDTPEGADYGYTACAMTICQVQSPALAAPLNFGCFADSSLIPAFQHVLVSTNSGNVSGIGSGPVQLHS